MQTSATWPKMHFFSAATYISQTKAMTGAWPINRGTMLIPLARQYSTSREMVAGLGLNARCRVVSSWNQAAAMENERKCETGCTCDKKHHFVMQSCFTTTSCVRKHFSYVPFLQLQVNHLDGSNIISIILSFALKLSMQPNHIMVNPCSRLSHDWGAINLS